ncbi:glycosyltransferase family 4 protein [Hymenobacter cavernae]|uniref:Glycosyl transferase n=1 Tax=Hymenobacter cavernae TaxID=2044852 RepID=A0ABQ1U4Z8_9BACT|nr:glycosyltransferase family 4 protein [Hymenobacter cavernae]GGF09050.1 glycosyl transferase [Hymenobacter cavernae]
MTADTVGGVWTYALELIRGLAPYGTHVALATMGAPLSEAQRQQVATIENLTLYESTYQLEWMDNPWDDVSRAGQWLLDLASKLSPDLIHLNGMAHGSLAWGKPVLVVVHSCVLSWWRAVLGEDAPISWDTYREWVSRGLRAANRVVAPTEALLTEVEKLYGPFRASSVVYNGCDPQHFRPSAKEPFILSMGRVWDEAKNISLLASIAANLPWPVYIAGDATHPTTGETLALPNVHVLGKLSATEAAAWLSRAAIYVMPAKYEPFGLTLLEAALSGCALVAGRIGTLTEVWDDAAAYANPQDAQALQTVLLHLIEDDAYRKKLADLAAKRAQRYTAAHMVQAYHHLYQQLLAGEATPDFTEPSFLAPPTVF